LRAQVSHCALDYFQKKNRSHRWAVKIALLTHADLEGFSTSRIGNRLINYLGSTIERLVPHSTEFTIVDVIDGYSYGPFGQTCDKDSWRWLHDLIAFVSRLVEHELQ
jgi:hypothetical protein